MMPKKTKENNLIKLGDIIEQKQILDTNEKTFEKLMFIYSIAIKELKNKIEILQDEFKILYDYELTNGQIERAEEIIQKVKDEIEDYTNEDIEYKIKIIKNN